MQLLHLLLTASLAAAFPQNSPDPPIAHTKNGTIQGLHLPSFNQDTFLSVPFALPPVGPLRFRHPHSYNSTYPSTPLLATTHGPSCPGYGGFSEGRPMAEDCLTLDITRPSNTHGQRLPVMVWIYGGGFTGGAAADERYNLSYVVQASVAIGKPVVAVALNYRLSGWGFLAGTKVGELNAGLWDQRLALRWVKENVEAFGGDKEKVTIWGESAGAFSVGFHLLAEGGTGGELFRAAILQSGSSVGPRLRSLEDYDSLYTNLTDIVGCTNSPDSLQCLREVPFEDLDAAMGKDATVSAGLQSWNPVIDGVFIPSWPADLLSAGKFAKVPILTGANTDEGTATFWAPRGTINTDADVADFALSFSQVNASHIPTILELYPDIPALGCPFNTGDERFADQGYMFKRSAAIATDYWMQAPRRLHCEYTAAQRVKVYSYRFDQGPYNGKLELIATVAPVYATHYAEIGAVFGNPDPNLTTYGGPDPAIKRLSELVQRSWISFAHDLDPNNHGVRGAPKWPEYGRSTSNIVFKANGTYIEKDDYRKEQLAFWKSLGV